MASGPFDVIEPIDTAAIARTASTTALGGRQVRRTRAMLTAARLIAAMAIVSLGAVVPLSSVGQTPPSTLVASHPPSPSSDVLDGFVTDEVEPGVFRVIEDGAGHDLVAEPPILVTVAPDDSVWLLRSYTPPGRPHGHGPTNAADALIELGEPGTHRLTAWNPTVSVHQADLAVDREGLAWLVGRYGRDLETFDGSSWTRPAWPHAWGEARAVQATADGAVWATAEGFEGGGPQVARLIDGTWTRHEFDLESAEHPRLEGPYHGDDAFFAPAADGTAWLANGAGWGRAAGFRGLLHYDGERWETVELPVARLSHAGPLALGPDGTLWVYLHDEDWSPWYLARLDAAGWSVFGQADGVPRLVSNQNYESRLAVDGEGSVWIAAEGENYGLLWPAEGPAWLGLGESPPGVLAFDGRTWRQYLRGVAVNRLAIASDGTVLATARGGCSRLGEGWPEAMECNADDIDWSRAGLYAITPAAQGTTQ